MLCGILSSGDIYCGNVRGKLSLLVLCIRHMSEKPCLNMKMMIFFEQNSSKVLIAAASVDDDVFSFSFSFFPGIFLQCIGKVYPPAIHEPYNGGSTIDKITMFLNVVF
ncbi:hypothetical protein Ancab_005760 [Ancistrocladus abbreviatus]